MRRKKVAISRAKKFLIKIVFTRLTRDEFLFNYINAIDVCLFSELFDRVPKLTRLLFIVVE